MPIDKSNISLLSCKGKYKISAFPLILSDYYSCMDSDAENYQIIAISTLVY